MGLAVGRRLAAEGRRVALLDLDGAGAQAAADELRAKGAEVIGGAVDVADRAAVDDALGEVRSRFGPIEIMVTSAGVDAFESFLDISLDAWERMIAVNLTGTFHCLQEAVPDMLAAKWGRIVTISAQVANDEDMPLRQYDKILFHPKNAIPVDFEPDNQLFVVPVEDVNRQLVGLAVEVFE